MSEILKIGISTRIVNASNYEEKRDALSHDWPLFLEKINGIPIFIPNSLNDVKKFLDDMKINCLILSGGDNIGTDKLRDKTEESILKYSIEKKIPIIGVCRGMQMINKFFDGKITLTKNEKHVAKNHSVKLVKKEFESFLGKEIIVNSFHRNIINKNDLGSELESFAIDKNDGTVEGFIHNNYPIIGVMWHPERDSNKDNLSIIKKLFNEKIFWIKS